jgi:uncharacterized protein involved in exopolysaccharide biosynthesis/Mrp family chromosome partitioning ATPase
MTTLWISKWPILSLALIGGLLTGLLGLTRPVLYEAKAQLAANTPSGPTAPGAPTSQEAINETIDGHLTMLVSQAQFRRVIAALRAQGEAEVLATLQLRGEETGPTATLARTARDVTNQARQLLSFDSTVSDDIPEDEDAAMIEALRNGVRAGQELRSRVISVGFTDNNRSIAVVVANTFAQSYVDYLIKKNRASLERDLVVVSDRLPEIQRELARAIARKENYIVTQGIGEQTSAEATAREVSQLKILLTSTKSNMALTRNQIENGTNLKRLSSATAGGLLTPSTPTPRKDLVKPDQQVAYYQAESNLIEEQIAALETRAGDAANRLSGLRALELDVDSEANRYNDVLAKRSSLVQRVKIPEPGITVLSAAWTPTDPKTMPAIFLVPPGIILFGLLAAIGALLLRNFDETLRSDSESEMALGIRSAGLLPKLTSPTITDLQRVIMDQFGSPYRRALASMMVPLLPEMTSARLSQVVLVTASTQRDGKSELAWSLALAAKRFGHRALLIDLDTREHQLTRSFRSAITNDTAAYDFADVVEGRCALNDALRSRADIDVDFMPAPSDAIGLLARVHAADLEASMERLCARYRFIVINAPTSVEAPELRMFAALADTILFAVGWGTTKRSLAHTALNLIAGDDGDVSHIRSVLTNVNLRQQKRFRFGDSADLLRTTS